MADFDDPRTLGLLAAGLAMLSSKGNAGQAIGQGGLLGLETMQTAKKSKREEAHADMLLKIQQEQLDWAKKDHQRRMLLIGELTGEGQPSPVAPQIPQQPSAMPGPPAQTFPLLPPGQAAPAMPPVAQAATGQQGLRDRLRAMGVPQEAILTAAMDADPAKALRELITEAKKPHFGQGQIPMVRTAEGFRAMPAEGMSDAIAAQTRAVEGAKSEFEMVDVPDGRGGTMKMPKAQALQILSGKAVTNPAAAPPVQPVGGRYSVNLKDATPDDIEALYKATRPGLPQGPVGRAPSPVEIRGAEEAIVTQEQAQRGATSSAQDVSKEVWQDRRKSFESAQKMQRHANQLAQLEESGIFSGPVQKWGGSFANVWNSAFPDAKISAERLGNTQQFQSEVSKMQQALGKAFPGQQSNYELQTITAALPQLMLSPEGRKQIYTAINNAAAHEEAAYRSASQHYMKNRGSLVGWEPPELPKAPAKRDAAADGLSADEMKELERLRAKHRR
jgi:hypothetical protein